MIKELTELDDLIEKVIRALDKEKGDFCISTTIPKEWEIEEEENWDINSFYGCVKGRINKHIIESIKEKTGKKYNSNGNLRIVFDILNNNFEIKKEPLFVFGRYMKHSREIAQTRWVCRDCRGKGCGRCEGKGKHYLSLEEIMGEIFKKEFQCEDYSLHASGREDVNVENHAGRAFVLELIKPEKIDGELQKVKKELEKDGRILVKDLKVVDRGFVELVSNSHFLKWYKAEIECSREVNKEDVEKIEKLKGTVINQLTPERVKHRRASKIRKRKIIDLEVLSFEKKKIEIEIRTEPGTYIKELIHGDSGRTKPSISSLLQIDAECKELTVTKIDDEFLDYVN